MRGNQLVERSVSERPTRVVMSIAGSDCSGGAGVQADLKTAGAFGVHCCTVITAVTAQNSREVAAIYPLAPEQVQAQISAVMADMPVAAIKIGMLASIEIVEVVARFVQQVVQQTGVPVVFDPVLVASNGGRLSVGDPLALMKSSLLPWVTLLTPNLSEAAALLGGEPARTSAEMEQQAKALLELGCAAVLLKGGHSEDSRLATDYLVTGEGEQVFTAPRVASRHTHGSGCTLATAVAAGLAQGLSLKQSVAAAKTFIQGTIANSDRLHLVEHNGPVHHFYQLW